MRLEIPSKHAEGSNLFTACVESSAVYRITALWQTLTHRVSALICHGSDILHFLAVVAAGIQHLSLAELDQLQLDS